MEEKKLDDAKDEDGNTEKAPDNDAEAKAANEALIQRRLEVVSIVCQALEGWCGVEPSAVTVELAAPPNLHFQGLGEGGKPVRGDSQIRGWV